MAGNTDLSMLLKSKVVELQVRLDVKGSLPALKKQVDDITRKLSKKYVKLGVKLNYTIGDLNRQLKTLSTTLENSKSFKPIKIKVDIDVAGSAKNIKSSLKEIQDTMTDFNKKYGDQLKQMQEKTKKAQENAKMGTRASTTNIKDTDNVQYFDNIKKYTKALGEAERLLRSKSPKGQGLFSTLEIKDAKGNLEAFTASLKRADGKIDSVRYKINQNKDGFELVDRKVLTSSQEQVKKAMDGLQDLQKEIFKTGGKANKFINESQALWDKGKAGTLTIDEVKNLKRRIAEEQTLQQVQKKQNAELLTQKKLIDEIKKARKQAIKDGNTDNVGKLNNMLSDVKTGDKDLGFIKNELDLINGKKAEQVKKEKELIANTKKRMQIMKQIREIDSKTVTTDKTSQGLIREIKYMAQRAKSGEDWLTIQKKMNLLDMSNSNDKNLQRSLDVQQKLSESFKKMGDLGILSSKQVQKAIAQIPITATRGLADLERQFKVVNRRLTTESAKIKREVQENYRDMLNVYGGDNVDKKNKMFSDINSAIKKGDVQELQKYIGQLYKGKVETVAVNNATDNLGRTVQRMSVRMQGAGQTVRTYTVDLNRANNSLREVSSGIDYNANRNLGIFEQLRIAMARVPVWMASMTAFYGTIRAVSSMIGQITMVDTKMTELNRVASSSMNLDKIFEGSVQMSKDLGNNLEDILTTMNEFARTFGSFSDRQLLDITKTAVLMSNVSELSADEAGRTLVSTMNAFNITAQDSIKIVDALNEVDNEYAVSTKQLAEGLSKSASTAKTFGVTMNENVGHITAISAVTGESGKIIGKYIAV